MLIEVHDEAAILRHNNTEIFCVQSTCTVLLTPDELNQCARCGFDVSSLRNCPDCGGCVICCGCKPGEG